MALDNHMKESAMAYVAFTVPGKPHAKQRPRHGGGFTYTPAKTVNAETFIRLTAAPHFAEPLQGPIAIEVVACFAPPKSWSQAKRNRQLGQPHIQRPDFDNIQKSVCDALNGIAYADDGQIAQAICTKVWAAADQTTIIVRQMEGGE